MTPKFSQDPFAEHFTRGIKAYKSGNLERALQEYRKAAESAPRDVESRNQIGVVLYAMGKLPQACKYFESLIEEGKKNAATYNNLGVVYTELMQFDQAFWAFQKAKEQKYDTAVLINVARILSIREEIHEASEIYKEAQHVAPSDPRAHYMYGIDCGFRTLVQLDQAFQTGQQIKVADRTPLLAEWTAAGTSVHHSRIDDILDRTIVIQAPMESGGIPVLYRPGQELVIVRQGDGSLYGISGKIVSRSSGARSTLELSRPKMAMRIQRRDYVRMDPAKQWSVEVTQVKTGKAASPSVPRNACRLLNISGGGALLEDGGVIPYRAGMSLLLHLDFDARPFDVSVEAVVIRRDKTTIGVMFTEIDSVAQEKIVQRIQQLQLDLRRARKM